MAGGWSTASTAPPPSSSPPRGAGVVQVDHSKPVPARSELIQAWQQRQDRIRTFRFAWTEQQTHPQGWLPNPRLRQHEWMDIPGLLADRSYAVSKTLVVDGNKMRYAFELDRKEEPDEVHPVTRLPDLMPDGSRLRTHRAFGEGKHYTYTSVFDGRTGTIRLWSVTDGPPAVIGHFMTNPDAQNLDTRAIMMAFRPLDPELGHVLVDRAITNLRRTLYQGRSTFLWEEQRDPSGWKTMMRIEPERDFLVSRYGIYFEQKLMMEIEIDYSQDAKWGWVPSGWRVSQMMADGSSRMTSVATVSSYTINVPIGPEEFQ